jgi:hypothetical protein
MKRVLRTGALAALGALAGCVSGVIEVRNPDGIAYTIEGRSMGLRQEGADVACAYNDRVKVQAREGRLFAGERDLGPVSRGDHVLLAWDGRVYVNGVERGTPQP